MLLRPCKLMLLNPPRASSRPAAAGAPGAETGLGMRTPAGHSSSSRHKRPLDIEELALTLPGRPGSEHGVQALLRHIILYIQFLQLRIQNTQNRLVPHSSHRAFLPLWTPRCTTIVTRQRGRRYLRPSKRRRLQGSVKKQGPQSAATKRDADSSPADHRQTLVPYVSSSSSDNGDAGPWMVSVADSPGSSQGVQSPQLCTSPAPQLCTSPTPQLCKSPAPQLCTSPASDLALSPSLRSSPAGDVLLEICPQALCMETGLFEDVQISSWSSLDVEDPVLPPTFSLDHSYQSQGKSSMRLPGVWNHTQQIRNDVHTVAASKRQKQWPLAGISTSARLSRRPQVSGPKGSVSGPKGGARRMLARSSSSSDECDTESPHHAVSAGTGLTQKPGGIFQLQRLRKKCVNGFIMFCRMNRQPYLRTYPGKASTAATKDLAELWKVMSPADKRPYRMKALHFSMLNNRLVKRGSPAVPCEALSPPKPLSVLLAEKSDHLLSC